MGMSLLHHFWWIVGYASLLSCISNHFSGFKPLQTDSRIPSECEDDHFVARRFTYMSQKIHTKFLPTGHAQYIYCSSIHPSIVWGAAKDLLKQLSSWSTELFCVTTSEGIRVVDETWGVVWHEEKVCLLGGHDASGCARSDWWQLEWMYTPDTNGYNRDTNAKNESNVPGRHIYIYIHLLYSIVS